MLLFDPALHADGQLTLEVGRYVMSRLTPPVRCILLLTLSAVLVVFYCWSSGMFGSYSKRLALGPIQVIVGPEEAWCFVEIDRVVHRPGPLVEPPNITMGHVQELIIFTPQGIKRRIPISIHNGVTFHPNISYIFCLDGEFYLYEGFSMLTQRSVYKWQDDHFELLPLAESEALLKAEQLDNQDPAEIEQVPRSNGWHRAFHDRGWFFEPARFEWAGRSFEIAKIDEEKLVRLEVRSLGEQPWSSDLVQFDASPVTLSRKEHASLWEEPEQSGHPRGQ
jgi:hypothetical protein